MKYLRFYTALWFLRMKVTLSQQWQPSAKLVSHSDDRYNSLENVSFHFFKSLPFSFPGSLAHIPEKKRKERKEKGREGSGREERRREDRRGVERKGKSSIIIKRPSGE